MGYQSKTCPLPRQRLPWHKGHDALRLKPAHSIGQTMLLSLRGANLSLHVNSRPTRTSLSRSLRPRCGKSTGASLFSVESRKNLDNSKELT